MASSSLPCINWDPAEVDIFDGKVRIDCTLFVRGFRNIRYQGCSED